MVTPSCFIPAPVQLAAVDDLVAVDGPVEPAVSQHEDPGDL
jgi:hypothetical protein